METRVTSRKYLAQSKTDPRKRNKNKKEETKMCDFCPKTKEKKTKHN